jgi:hypothetical protein
MTQAITPTPEWFASYEAAIVASNKAEADSKQIDAWFREHPIETEEQAEWAAKVGKFAADQAKQLDAARKQAKAPWAAAAKAIDDQFMPSIKRLQAIKQHAAKGIAAVEQAKIAAQTKALTADAPQSPEAIQAAVAVLAPPPEGAQLRERWELEILDEAQIPREYFTLDRARLDREARTLKGSFQVPGCRAIRKDQVVFR